MNRTGIILLVEDDKNIQRINHRILEREGFQVLCAGTLSEARELLQTHTPDVLVLDIMLPDGSGLSFCEKIRQKSKTEKRGLCRGVRTAQGTQADKTERLPDVRNRQQRERPEV